MDKNHKFKQTLSRNNTRLYKIYHYIWQNFILMEFNNFLNMKIVFQVQQVLYALIYVLTLNISWLTSSNQLIHAYEVGIFCSIRVPSVFTLVCDINSMLIGYFTFYKRIKFRIMNCFWWNEKLAFYYYFQNLGKNSDRLHIV